MKVLLVEDNAEMAEFISIAFNAGWPGSELVTTHQGRQAVELAETALPDVIILDLGLPDISGYDVLKRIRAFSDVPVIIETVRNAESDIVKGLELGADEYIQKPFGQLELLAKIRAVLRRHSPDEDSESLTIGFMRLDCPLNRFYIKEKIINITHTEQLILHRLLMARGRVVNHLELSEAIWGDPSPNEANNIRVYIRRLRKKFEDVSESPNIIMSKPGIGYYLKVHP